MSAAITAVAVGAAAIVGSQFLTKKPKVPGLAAIDPDAAVKDQANVNLAAFPDIKKLGAEVDAYNQAELDESFADIFPGYKDAARQAGRNIEDMLAGKLSKEASAGISRAAANRAVGTTGTFGPWNEGKELRDVGRAIADEQKTGLTALSGWLASAKGSLIAPKFDVTKMFTTNLFDWRQQERSAQFQRQNAANQVDAYYSTASRAGRGLEQAGGALVGYGTGGMGGGQKSGGGAPASAPYNYGNVDQMMNGPAQGGSSFYAPTSYGQQVNFGPSNYNTGSVNPYSTPYWGGS